MEELEVLELYKPDSAFLIKELLRCGCWSGEGCLLTKELAQCSFYEHCSSGLEPAHYVRKIPVDFFGLEV